MVFSSEAKLDLEFQGFAADCSLTAKEPFASNGIAVFSTSPLSRIACCGSA
jgi:hypothetical protein